MKRFSKRLLSMLLSVLMAIGFLVVGMVQASAVGYNVSKAVAYAHKYYDNDVGLCAQFVSDCLAEGGITIPKNKPYSSSTQSYQNTSGTLGAYTDPYSCSAAQLVWFANQGYKIITNPTNSDIALGDVAYMYSKNNDGSLRYRDGHVGIITNVDSGRPKYSAHNRAAKDESFSSGYPCTYVVKMPSVSAPPYATLSLSTSTILEGGKITFTVDSPGATEFWAGIDEYKNGSWTRIITYSFPNPFTITNIAGGQYRIYVTALNSAGSQDSYKYSYFNSIPKYPTPPPGFVDVTSSFADANGYSKSIFIKNVNTGKYVVNSAPAGNGAVYCNSSNTQSWESWTIGRVYSNGVWNGNVTLISQPSGKRLTTNGRNNAATASVSGSVNGTSQFRIYYNTSTGYYYFREAATGGYLAADIDKSNKQLCLTSTQPPEQWERFQISWNPDGLTSNYDLPNGYYIIQGVHSEKFISGWDSGKQLYIWPMNSSSAFAKDQYWYFARQSDGSYEIKNFNGNQVMDASNSSLINGSKIIRYADNDTANQRWYVIYTGNKQFKFVNKKTGCVLDVTGNNTGNGTLVEQWIDNSSSAQRFKLYKASSTITFNANGGTNAPKPQYKPVGYSITLSSAKPTRGGLVFAGWSTTRPRNVNMGTVDYRAGEKYPKSPNDADVELFAVWRTSAAPSTYTVTYDFSTNGGTSVNTADVEGLDEGAAVDLTPIAVKEGYTFVGWNTNANAHEALTSLKIGTSNITLYAIYSKSVAATFTDAIGVQLVNVMFYNNQTEVGIPAAPTQREYAGWVKQGWTNGPEIDIELTSLPVEIIEIENPTEPDSAEPVESEDATDLNEALSGVGSTGDEQFTTPEEPVTGFTIGLDAHSFYGLYERDVTLNYDSDGGSSVPAVTAKQQVNSFDLSAPDWVEFIVAAAPEKEGYDFLHWAFADGEITAPNMAIELSASAILKAVWEKQKPLSYTISYSADGEIYGMPEDQLKSVGEALILSEDIPFKEGYYFTGWATTNGGAVQYTVGATYNTDADLTLYPVMKKGADKQALLDSIIAKMEIGNDNYTEASWRTFEVAMSNAILISGTPEASQQQVDNALSALNSTFVGLTQNLPSVNKTILLNRINEVKDTPNNNYTAASWNAFQSALTQAQSMANNASATQAQVDAALAALNSAFAGLTQNPAPVDNTKYITLWGKQTRYQSNILNWLLCIICFGWIWMAF